MYFNTCLLLCEYVTVGCTCIYCYVYIYNCNLSYVMIVVCNCVSNFDNKDLSFLLFHVLLHSQGLVIYYYNLFFLSFFLYSLFKVDLNLQIYLYSIVNNN